MWRLRLTGRDRVHRDPERAVRPRQPPAHRHDPALAGGVDDRAAEPSGPPALRGEGDDPARRLGAPHRLRHRATEEERGLEVRVQLGVPVFLGDLPDVGPAPQHRCAVHQGVDRAELGCGFDQLLAARPACRGLTPSARAGSTACPARTGTRSASRSMATTWALRPRRTRLRSPNPMPPLAPVTSTTLSVQPGTEVPAHRSPPLPRIGLVDHLSRSTASPPRVGRRVLGNVTKPDRRQSRDASIPTDSL